MKQLNLSDVQEATEFTRLPAGAYKCVITDVVDVEDKEYLKISYDIAEGDYLGYYTELRKNHPDWEWVGAYVKSYKVKALPMLKRFCSAVSKSNGNYIFDAGSINSDEKTLVGKMIGLVLREEEYYSNSGDKRTRLVVYRECAVDTVDEQKVPECKRLEEEVSTPRPSADEFIAVPEGSAEVPF